MAKVVLSDDFFRKAMQSDPVRQALSKRRDAVSARAVQLAAQEGVEGFKVTNSDGTRPKGRPYARVSTPMVDQEFGTWSVPKRRILGRAAGYQTPPIRPGRASD